MNVETAINIIYEGLVGEKSIPNDLSMKKELNHDKLIKIKEALKFLIVFYRDKKDVTKKLAFCFIDIYSAFQFKKEYYSEEELIKFEDIGIEIQELAEILLDPSSL